MKQLLTSLFILICCTLFGQQKGNEWINYNQQYYSFDIYRTGLYRLDHATLTGAGIPVSSFTPANIQIFGREKEIPLHIVDGNDNSFDPGDYILFYAEKNDGWLDSLVYRDPTYIANPGYSLFNDTIHYFFSWNNSTTNKRFVVDSDVNFNAYTPVNYVLCELATESVGGGYNEGFISDRAAGSVYAGGEGYSYGQVTATPGNTETIGVSFPTANAYSGPDAPPAEAHFSVVATTNALPNGTSYNHHLRVTIGPSSYQLIDTLYFGYHHTKRTKLLPSGTVSNGSTLFQMQAIGNLGVAVDGQSLNYARLRYSRLPNSGGQQLDKFRVAFNTNAAKSRIDLAGCPWGSPLVLSFNGTPRIHTAVNNAGVQQFLIPNVAGGSPNTVIVTDASIALSVTGMKPVNGNGTFTDFSQIDMEKAYLIIGHKKLQSSTTSYAAYRSSPAGGSRNVVRATIDELYDQYGGGIPKHIFGVRRFAQHAWELATEKPVGMLLAGKGLSTADAARTNVANYERSLIPAFGHPASDVAITSGLHGTKWEPLIPTGRIAAETDAALNIYLTKLQEYEEAQGPNSMTNLTLSSDWQKQVLHFVGGSTYQDQQTFRFYMDSMARTISDSNYAANVTSYYKTSSDPLDPNVVAGVTERISNGVSLMNFFSHAAVSNNGFEVNIDAPENWNNPKKYPVIIGNSCYNGNIYSTDNGSMSEKSVILPNEGAIAFLSSTVLGYDSYLFGYSSQLYRQFSPDSYAETIGEQIKRAIAQFQLAATNQHQLVFYESTASQMVFHGDPLLKLNWHAAPEIHLKQENVFFTPEDLNLTVDTITMNIVLYNLGSSVNDTFDLTIRRNFPLSTADSVYTLRIPELHYRDTIKFRFPMQPAIGVGENVFTIQVDLPTQIGEEVEEYANNQLTKSLFIKVDGIQPIWPYDFAVVPIDSVTVKASTIDPISPSVKTYLFELDTTHFYNSPQYRKFSVTEAGGVKYVNPSSWKNASGAPFPLVCEDSMVYFWRVALDSSTLVWTEFSFQYIPGKEGWGQDHFFQFKKNGFYGLDYDMVNRRLNFPPPQAHTIEINTFDFETYYTAWFIDGDLGEYGMMPFAPDAIHVFIIDPVTLEPWKTNYLTENPDHAFGAANDNPTGDPEIGFPNRSGAYFGFRQDNPAQLAAFSNLIENIVPEGHYVGIYTTTKTLYSDWTATSPAIYNTFQNTIGSTLVHAGQPEKPFALFFKKGDPSSLVESHWPSVNADGAVELNATIYESEHIGLETTPFIGPAFDWKTVYWKRDSLEAFPSDSVRLRIEAYNSSQNLQFTIDTLFTPQDSIQNLNSLIPAANYPFIKLSVLNSDKQFFTPAQIARLHVLYQPVPEAAIDGTDGYYLSASENLYEGQTVSFAVDVKNVSAWPMDSLLVSYYIEDANHVRHYLSYPRQDSLLVGGILRDTISFNTQGYAGPNSLWMEVNPYVNGSTIITDQPEQFHFNNLLQLPFYVIEDNEHPILDVTFDGIHILNNDIVSPKSEVLITLKDENVLQIMNSVTDTTLFGIYLTDPQGNQRRVPFTDANGNTVMQWIPANAQNMKFKIVWPADFKQDGKYTLLVQGTDRSGNLSGDLEYRISFEVIHESSITYMMNYPNPFSTSTRFVFTLTGSEVPEDMIIQIMTVTGRVVREITEDQIGRITIGRNISEYAWDGTDEFGDQLANGVYLYRVKAKINGEDIKHRESGADTYFKKEFGKMYLMR